MFENFIVIPILNILIFIQSFVPGHNLGVSIIIFTIIVRILLWPLLKKQLHHTKAMRQLQPELKRIKKEAKGDRQKEAQLTMALYKEREISPFSSLGIVLVQLPILIGLYIGLRRVIDDPNNIIKYAYEPLKNTGYLKELAGDMGKFSYNFIGIDLKRAAMTDGAYYFPALLIAAGSAVVQYFQSKQLMPDQGKAKTVREILKESAAGKQADQAEMNAAVSKFTLLLIPGLILLISVGLPSALPLYWLVSGVVAYYQQSRILGQDEEELITAAEDGSKVTITQPKKTTKTTPKNKKSTKKKRR